MHTTVKHQAVNWTDGMKLSRQHFLQNDAYHVEGLVDVAHCLLHDFNYGLLPALDGMHTSLEYDLSPNRDRFEVILRSCNAITRGGVRILQHPQLHNKQQVSASVSAIDFEGQEEARLAVVITANPFERVPVGEPDPEEAPLRHPFTTPLLRLEIIPESLLNLNYTRGYHLVIGKLKWQDRQFRWDDRYVPACAVTEAHPILVGSFEEIDQLQNALRKAALAIVQNIHQKSAQNRPDYDPELARNTAKLCTVIVDYLADSAFAYKNTGRFTPPLKIVEQVSRLAGRLSAVLNLMPGAERERLLTYYSQWTSIQPVKFSASLSDVADVQYDHLDLERSISLASQMMRLLTMLWNNLSGLEFIGKLGNNLVMGIDTEHRNSTMTKHSVLD